MPRYYFNLRDGGRGYVDRRGVALRDEEAAIDYAGHVASDLAKNCRDRTRRWRIDVVDAQGRQVFAARLVAYDTTLAGLPPVVKASLERLCERCRQLEETICRSRDIRRRSRSLVARARRRPYLVAERGELVLDRPLPAWNRKPATRQAPRRS